MRLHDRIIIGALATAVCAFIAAPALAQTDEQRAGARAAAEAGLEAFDQKRYADAIDLLNRAERLVHSTIHLLHIGRAHAELGQLVKAREAYLKLTRDELPKNASRMSKDAVQSGERELKEIEAKLPYVSIVVQGAGANDVRVMRNGERVPQELLGVPHPVDPGEYKFQATADGLESAPSTVVIREGSKETVLLTLRPVSGTSTPSTPSDTAQTSGTGSVTADPGSGEDSGGISGLRIGAYIGFGVAVVGGALGTIFLIQSGSTRDEADQVYAQCPPNTMPGGPPVCTPAQQAALLELDGDADSQRNIGVAGLVVGGVGLAAGVTLLILDLNRREEQARHERPLRPVVGLGYVGLAGTF